MHRIVLHSTCSDLDEIHIIFVGCKSPAFPPVPVYESSIIMSEEFSYSDVSSHSTKKDLYVVIHDKVYNASSFIDEHP